jgi:uncharacterized damage-inducible protein DinB
MHDLLKQYIAYNIWANKKLFDVIKKCSPEQQHQTITSSFTSLYATVKHIWFAEEAWWKRHKLLENFTIDAENFNGDFTQLYKSYFAQANLWKHFIDTCTDKQLKHTFKYVRQKKVHKIATFEMLLHICNHASYHRGQLVTMLRQVGVTKIPKIDFSAFV